jgi:DNA-directed RNA polymerase subunit M/transcription elongation factor TFIIS
MRRYNNDDDEEEDDYEDEDVRDEDEGEDEEDDENNDSAAVVIKNENNASHGSANADNELTTLKINNEGASKPGNAAIQQKQEPTAVLKATTDNIPLTGTYKVKIRPRRPSSNNLAQLAAAAANDSSESAFNTVPLTPTKTDGGNSGTSTPLKTTSGIRAGSILSAAANALLLTPSKLHTTASTLSASIPNEKPVTTAATTGSSVGDESTGSSTAATSRFECPECDKKFVSYFGLVQHIDQHPTLSVTCPQCEITFENHQALVAHNLSVHQSASQSTDESTTVTASKQPLVNENSVKEKEK